MGSGRCTRRYRGRDPLAYFVRGRAGAASGDVDFDAPKAHPAGVERVPECSENHRVRESGTAGPFALVLALRHSEVLFNRLRVRQDYEQLAGSVACSSSISDLQRKIRSEFDQADYNIRLLSDTLEPKARCGWH